MWDCFIEGGIGLAEIADIARRKSLRDGTDLEHVAARCGAGETEAAPEPSAALLLIAASGLLLGNRLYMQRIAC